MFNRDKHEGGGLVNKGAQEMVAKGDGYKITPKLINTTN